MDLKSGNDKDHKAKLSDYEVGKKLGKGGYSTVFLARHKKTDVLYALKCINRFRKKSDKTSQIRKEIAVLLKLKHNNVIKLYDWFEDKNKIYLVLEYIDGKDLAAFFKKEIPIEKDAIYIIRQICEALRYCHQHKIVHRDIKLGNILINQNNQVKLTDFGLCATKKTDDDTFRDEVGTVRFTSPELLNRQPYNEKVDLWALGITIFIMLTGQYPFDGDDKESIFKRIKADVVDYDEVSLTNLQRDLISKLLVKDPAKRIDIDQVLAHPWFNFDVPKLANFSNSNSNESSDSINSPVKKSRGKGDGKRKCKCSCHHK